MKLEKSSIVKSPEKITEMLAIINTSLEGVPEYSGFGDFNYGAREALLQALDGTRVLDTNYCCGDTDPEDDDNQGCRDACLALDWLQGDYEDFINEFVE